ncbi:hypothetical protein ABZ863_15460 [Saccharomonospora sp. NPDC046836]|uniref:hypothetical protein n=1 Tax=Saccharomonospora sp. NPDC046836 TaxID=3156921 RepID=UPI0033E27899
MIAKWLVKNSDVLIFDEPTRGIDVGAKEEISPGHQTSPSGEHSGDRLRLRCGQ